MPEARQQQQEHRLGERAQRAGGERQRAVPRQLVVPMGGQALPRFFRREARGPGCGFVGHPGRFRYAVVSTAAPLS